MISAPDLDFPPPNSTTATLHFSTSDDCSTPRLDCNFTVDGIVEDRDLGKWLRVLLNEHANDQLNASLDVLWHHPDGHFDYCEVTACRTVKR